MKFHFYLLEVPGAETVFGINIGTCTEFLAKWTANGLLQYFNMFTFFKQNGAGRTSINSVFLLRQIR